MSALKDRMVTWVSDLQLKICSNLEKFETKQKFTSVDWSRPGGGGGHSRVLQDGNLFEKAGVNTSMVHGELPPKIQDKLGSKTKEFFASGISLVLHPHSPQIPTVHANFRYFEQPDRAWFGGGVDLTPYVWNEKVFTNFHKSFQKPCENFEKGAHQKFKAECDKYFYIPHRDEHRGVGGIFFDYLQADLEKTFTFVQACGEAFISAYSGVLEATQSLKFTERQKKFQLLRRGRYVEFNLVYDRGTLFGLETKGNIESILMSLPPVVNFDFQAPMETTDDEKKLMKVLRQAKDWT